MLLTAHSDFLRPAAALFRRLRYKAFLPILEHVRITVDPGSILARLEYTDLDIHITTMIPLAGPTSPGAFTLQLRELTAVLAAADKGSVLRFTTHNGPDDATYPVTILLVSKKLPTESTYTGLDASQYPPAPATSGDRTIFQTATLAAISHILPVVAVDETRYVLNGVFITPDLGGAAVATDGRRLAISRVRIPCEKAILPAKLVSLLDHPLLQSAAIAHYDPERSIISFSFGKTTVHSKTIDGNFPNYMQVIPPKPSFSATLAEPVAASLLPWLRQQAARLAKTKSNSIMLTIRANTINLSARDAASPAVSTSIPAYAPDAPDGFAISFNPDFLADGLALGLRTIDFLDEMSPGVLTNGTTRYVIMPMRVADGPPQAQPQDEAEADPDAPEYVNEEQTDCPADPEAIEVEATTVG
jgi:DNA polymerase III subunit beta